MAFLFSSYFDPPMESVQRYIQKRKEKNERKLWKKEEDNDNDKIGKEKQIEIHDNN